MRALFLLHTRFQQWIQKEQREDIWTLLEDLQHSLIRRDLREKKTMHEGISPSIILN